MDAAIPTIAEAARQIAAKELSPVELTKACLDRVQALDNRLHAFYHVTEERALAEARAAEAPIMARGPSGPLHGIPIGLKDIVDTKGIPTTCGSKLLQDNIPTEDATCAARLAAAGTVLIGKLTTHEFADGGPSFDLPAPPARNPWNPDHFTAGSSSGTGAAVAAGMILCGIGTDTGGSIRGPAALVRHRRAEADLWSGQPRRRRAGRLQPRPYRADGVDGRGLRDHAAGACRPRPARPGERRPAGPRLPRRARRRDQGTAGSASSTISMRSTTRSARAPSAALPRRSRRSAISGPRSARCSCRHCRIGRPAAR